MSGKSDDTAAIKVNGRWLSVGSEVSISGERGTFRYSGFQTTSSGKIVLNFIGGPSGREMMRSFYPDRVKTVHNTRK